MRSKNTRRRLSPSTLPFNSQIKTHFGKGPASPSSKRHQKDYQSTEHLSQDNPPPPPPPCSLTGTAVPATTSWTAASIRPGEPGSIDTQSTCADHRPQIEGRQRLFRHYFSWSPTPRRRRLPRAAKTAAISWHRHQRWSETVRFSGSNRVMPFSRAAITPDQNFTGCSGRRSAAFPIEDV